MTAARQDKEASPVLKDQLGRLALLGPSERRVTPAIQVGQAHPARRAARVLQVRRGVQGTLGRLDERVIPARQDRPDASAIRVNWGRPVLSGKPVTGAIPV